MGKDKRGFVMTFATVRTGPHSSAQGELVKPDLSPSQHVQVMLDILDKHIPHSEDARLIGEALAELKAELERT